MWHSLEETIYLHNSHVFSLLPDFHSKLPSDVTHGTLKQEVQIINNKPPHIPSQLHILEFILTSNLCDVKLSLIFPLLIFLV